MRQCSVLPVVSATPLSSSTASQSTTCHPEATSSTSSSSRAVPLHSSDPQPDTRKRTERSADSALEATQRAHSDEQQPAADEQPRKRAKEDADEKDEKQPRQQLDTAAATTAAATDANAESKEADLVSPAWPLDLTGLSFLAFGDVHTYRIEQQLNKAGAILTKAVAKVKQQYAVVGAPSQCTRKMTSKLGSTPYYAAKAANKVFMSEAVFWQWMKKVDEWREEQQKVADSVDERLHNTLLECTPLPDVLVDLVVEYAAAQEPVVSLFRDRLAMEQLASDGQFAATLPALATLEEIKQLEEQYREGHRLPTWLRQLLRLHNGVRWVGESDQVLVPSLADMSFQLRDFMLRRLRWTAIREQDSSSRVNNKKSTLVTPEDKWVVIDNGIIDLHECANLYAHSLDDTLTRYVNEWQRRIAVKECAQSSQQVEGGQQQEGGRETVWDEKQHVNQAQAHHQAVTAATLPILTTATTTLSPTAVLYASCRPPLSSATGDQQLLVQADYRLFHRYKRSLLASFWR